LIHQYQKVHWQYKFLLYLQPSFAGNKVHDTYTATVEVDEKAKKKVEGKFYSWITDQQTKKQGNKGNSYKVGLQGRLSTDTCIDVLVRMYDYP